MDTPRLTDERLKAALNTNQPSRERMCLGILSLDRNYSDIRPRRPEGGPDGGRDIECKRLGEPFFGAIGFVNNACDSAPQKTDIRNKFKDDIRAARKADEAVKAFVFFCNIDLTPAETMELSGFANEHGFTTVEIYWRERLRIALDNVEGLALRYQYLAIPLSTAEQAAFFARWGAELNVLIAHSFHEVDRRLQRIEFNQERLNPLRNIMFIMHLTTPISTEDMPSFRAMMVILAPSPRETYTSLLIAIANDDGKWDKDHADIGRTLVYKFCVDDVSNVITKGTSIRPNPVRRVSSAGGFSEYTGDLPHPTLGDLDENDFVFFVNSQLGNLIDKIEIWANGYILWQGTREMLGFDSPHSEVRWPFPMTEDELTDKWVRVMPADGRSFRFSEYTPEAWWQPHKHGQ